MVAEKFALDMATRFESDADPSTRTLATMAKNQIQSRIAEKGKP
jgi:hypothetical protein